MNGVDMRYVVGSMAALSGVPVRLYEGGKLVLFQSPVKLPRDPMALYEGEIWAIRGHVGYFATPDFQYYGLIRCPAGAIVMGPTSQILAGEQDLKALAFRLDVPPAEVHAFLTAMQGIQRLPVETLLQWPSPATSSGPSRPAWSSAGPRRSTRRGRPPGRPTTPWPWRRCSWTWCAGGTPPP